MTETIEAIFQDDLAFIGAELAEQLAAGVGPFAPDAPAEPQPRHGHAAPAEQAPVTVFPDEALATFALGGLSGLNALRHLAPGANLQLSGLYSHSEA